MRALTLWALLGLAGCGAFAIPGRACQKHEECAGLPRGYCSRAEICTRECSETDPCTEIAACRTFGARSVCLPTCEDDTGCFKGFSCLEGVCQVKAPLEPPVN